MFQYFLKPKEKIKVRVNQVLSYLRNYPVDRYSKDGIRPRLFAVTIGRLITFYKHRYDIDDHGVQRLPEKLDHHLYLRRYLRNMV